MDAIVNLHREPALREKLDYHPVHNNTVLIDDRTELRNPFRAGPGVSRSQALARYRADLWRRIRAGEIGIEELARLDGCWLACWCDENCHGEVLARAAAWAASVLAEREAE